MEKSCLGRWRSLIYGLRKKFPAAVTIRRLPIENSCGTTITNKKTGKTTIYIDSGLGFDPAVETLIHEYAHVIDNHERFDCDKSQHSETWGVCYSKVYRFAIAYLKGELDG